MRFVRVLPVLALAVVGDCGFGQTEPAAPVAPAGPAATIPAAILAALQKPGTVYNVREFGAKADGTTKDTAALQKALDMCAVNGGGEVLVPAGNYLIGSVQIGNRTILRLEKGTTLTGSADVADYPMMDVRWEGRWETGHRGLIYASAVSHIGIVGPGAIVLAVGADHARDGYRNPVVLEPVNCTDVKWEDFTVQQGGNWATHPVYCTDLSVKGVTIRSGRDGLDVDSCKDVRVEKCTIESGDDCISLKSGRGMDGARLARPTEDVLITDCTLTGRTFACLGIGSETSGGVKNVKMEHCKLTARQAAIYIKTRIGRAGGNENIACSDLDVAADMLLRVNLTKGGNSSTADQPVEGISGYAFGKNISITNARVKVVTQLVQADEISALRPLEGLVLENITGTAGKGMTIANATGVVLKDINVTVAAAPVLGIFNVKGTGLEGAATIKEPVDPAPGNAAGRGGGFGGRGGFRGGPGRGRGAPGTGPAPETAPASAPAAP